MAVDKETGMTDKMVRFCQEYVIDLNATQAAIRSGYSESTARQIGGENLTKPAIKKYVQNLMDVRARRLQITADEVLVRLDKMSRASVKDLFDGADKPLRVSEWDDDFAQAVNGIKFTKQRSPDSEAENPIYDDVVDVKLVDKKGVTELLGKHLKLFTDKVEHSGEIDGEVTNRVVIQFTDDTGSDSD